MTKQREQIVKSHRSKAKQRTKHEVTRQEHFEEQVEGERPKVESPPNAKRRGVPDQSASE